ncbi:MAG TPA: hypothetical protein VJI96_05390 [Candidatus Andersenbacteria bacterium]|nr:hypothetical protein [Candidatus Andersenbacteria bacterium]
MEYKPNIYPIMYWALVYGIIAASVLLLIKILADFINIIWFFVFLAGLIWGGFRKYKQDKAAWMQGSGIKSTSKSAKEEFKEAARDIAQAGKEMIAKQVQENAQAAQESSAAGEIPVQENTAPLQEDILSEEPEAESEEEPKTPQSPLQPLV